MAKYLILIVVIVFFIIPVVGCGERLDLSEVTTKAITATIEAQSYRASAVGTYTVDGETDEITFEQEFAAPDRSHEKVSSDGDWSETTFIGNQSYIRGSDIPQWRQLPYQYDDPFSGGTAMAQATSIPLEKELEPLNWLVELEKLPGEEIDGVDYWHYRGKVDMDAYVDMLQKTAKSEDRQIPQHVAEHLENMRRWMMNFELWVEKDSYLIRQLKSEVRFTMVNPNTGEENLFTGSTTKRFYDFNKPISIEPPQM